jgi:hypothetical protein
MVVEFGGALVPHKILVINENLIILFLMKLWDLLNRTKPTKIIKVHRLTPGHFRDAFWRCSLNHDVMWLVGFGGTRPVGFGSTFPRFKQQEGIGSYLLPKINK